MRSTDKKIKNKNIKKYINLEKSKLDGSVPREIIKKTLKNVSDLILESKILLKNASIVRLSICISSYALDDKEDCFKIAFSYFKFIEKHPKLSSVEFNLATLITYDDLLDSLNVNYLENLSPKLKSKCDELLEKTEPVDLKYFKTKFEDLRKQINLFAFNPSLNNSLKTAFNFLAKKSKENNNSSVLASKALNYLSQEHDVLPDNLGIFGIADDVYVLENTANNLGGLNYGEELFAELNTIVDSQEQLFIAEEDYLRPLNKQLQLLLTKIKFLTNEDGRYVFALPDTGPVAFLYFLNKILDFNYENISRDKFDDDDLKQGEKIYFKIYEGYFEATFQGLTTYDGEELLKLQFEDDLGNPSLFYNKKILNFAFKSVHKNAKILRKREKFKIDFLDETYIPKRIRDRNLNFKNYIFLTNKYKIDTILNQIKPFGSRFTDLISFEYFRFKRDGSEISEMIGNSLNRIKVFSDASLAREHFQNHESSEKLNVICDSSDLGTRFLEELGELDLRKAAKIMFFYAHNDKYHLNICQEKQFNFCYPGKAFADMGEPKTYTDTDSVIKDYENLLYKSYLSPNIIYENLSSERIDTLFSYSKKVSRNLRKEGNFLLSYELNHVSEKLLQNIFGFDEKENLSLQSRMNDLIDKFRLIDDEDTSKFKTYLETEKENLLHLNKERNFLNFINKFDQKKIAILARSLNEKINLENFLKSFGKADVDVIYFQSGFLKSFNKDLLIPVMPSTRLIHILNQFKISNNLILNFTKDEYQFFRRMNNRFNKWTLLLENLNKKSFYKSKVASKRNIGKVEEKIDDFVENEVDNELQFLVRNKFQMKDSKSYSISNIRESIVARAFSIQNTSEILFLPPNSEVIAYDTVGRKFIQKEIEDIYDGEIILIRSDNSGDPYDEISGLLDPHFRQKKERSSIWKKMLKNYSLSNNLSIEDLTNKLQSFNVSRHPNTIKGWLEKANTIAPLNPQKTLTAILKLTKNSTPTVEQILSSRDDVIQVRRKAAGEIIRYLPKLRHDEILSKESIDIRFSKSLISMKIVHIETFVDELEVSPSKIWQMQNLDTV